MLLLCALLICAAGCRSGTLGREPLLYVNGEAVSEEELALLDGDVEQAVRRKVLQQWAAELGAAEKFDWPAILTALEAENQRRAEVKESGGVIYGVVEYTPLQYYNILMGEEEQAIRDSIAAGTAEEELRAWYEANIENFREFGAVTAHVTAVSGTVTLADYELELSPDNYRSVSEGNEELAARLLELPVGQTGEWTDELGVDWYVECLARAEDTYQPFEDVQGAAGEQYAADMLRQELERRAAESTVEDLRGPSVEK